MAFFLKHGPMGEFDEEGQAGPRGHFRIAWLELTLAEREKRAEEPLVIRQTTQEKDALARCFASSDESFRFLKAVLSSDAS